MYRPYPPRWITKKRFIQVGNSLLLSKQFHALSTGSRFLYFCMAMESGGRKNFILPQKDAKKYGIAPSSLRKHINELEAARFIRVYSGKPTREPNRYEFCLSWKLPPSPLCSHTPMAICSKSVSDGNKGGRKKSHWLCLLSGCFSTGLLPRR